MHLDTLGIFAILGYLVGSDLGRLYFAHRRCKQLDAQIARMRRLERRP